MKRGANSTGDPNESLRGLRRTKNAHTNDRKFCSISAEDLVVAQKCSASKQILYRRKSFIFTWECSKLSSKMYIQHKESDLQ